MKEHIITSSFNSKKYQLDVLLPKNYQRTDTFRYPVLYVLDGKYSFTSFYSIASLLDLGKEISDFIIVAIDGEHLPDPDWMVNRFNDFTPPIFHRQILPGQQCSSYLIDINFRRLCLFLIQYKVTLYHSLTNSTKLPPAGLIRAFAWGFCWLLSLTRPGLFQQYSMNSPPFGGTTMRCLHLRLPLSKTPPPFQLPIFLFQPVPF